MKFVDILPKWATLHGAPIALFAASVALSCSKESGSRSAERGAAVQATAAATPSSPPAPPAPAAEESASEAAVSEPDAAAGPRLGRVTAEELRAAIRAEPRKATLVNAWASWCGPCRRELPMIQALAANLKPQGVEILLVSVDEDKDEAKAAAYLVDNAITLRSYRVSGSLEDFKRGINPRWPGMLPASFLFDRAARLVHFWGGEAFENELTPTIEAFLAGRPIPAETNYGLAPGKLE